jgi:phosphatidylglycerol:prolipoprotein diacylglycerol transferase
MRPILFHLGGSPVYSYGVMLFVAFMVGTFIGVYVLGKRGVPSTSVYLLAAALALSALVGARLFYVFGHLKDFSGNWGKLLDLSTIGMVFYGGLLLAIPVGYLVVRKLKMNPGQVANAAGLALFPAIAIARIGCFLNGCCGGKPSGLPWAVTFPGATQAVHPTQIYEGLLDLFAFALLLLASRYMDRGWDLFLLALAAYAAIRFVMEFFRVHTTSGAAVFFQALSVAIFAVALGIFWYRRRGGQGRRPKTVEEESGLSGGF